MNPLLQVAAGLSPAILILLLIALFRRSARLRACLLLVPFLAAAGACAVQGLGLLDGAGGNSVPPLEPAVALELAQAAAERGDSALARSLLEDPRLASADEGLSALCLARTYAMEGNAPAAAALYRKAGALVHDLDIKEELDAASRAALAAPGDTGAADDMARLAQKALSKAADDGDVAQAAKVMSEINQYYETHLAGGEPDEDEVRRLTRRLRQLEEDRPELFDLKDMRLARLKMNLLSGSYRDIASNVREDAGYQELMTVSELYLNGYVRQSYFDESYGQTYARQCAVVAKQVEKLYDEYYSGESRAVRATVKAYLDSLEDAQTRPALVQIKHDLYDYTQTPGAQDSSKVFLQLSKMENAAGNTAGAEQYLSASLGAVDACLDDSYTQPMYQLIDIIADKDEPERLKDVPGYVEDVIGNSYVVPLPEPLTKPAPKDPDKPGDGRDDGKTVDFGGYMTDYVSQKRAGLNITSVDAGQFPEITASVSISTAIPYTDEELQRRLSVRDCGSEIADFTLRSITYDRVNVLLCCDVSGSMSGSAIENLRQAVKLFAGSLENNQQMALVTFASSIQNTYPFGTSQEDILAAADALRANGGTDMYGAALYSVQQFTPTPGERNVVILLSDGEDGYRRSEETIRNELGQAARDNDVILYSLGLGSSVDTGYLSTIAGVCGGSFLYVDNSQTLDSFYEYINGLLFSQYELKYTAADTLRTSRELRLALKDDSNCFDVYYYSLNGGGESPDSGENALPLLEGVQVTGLDTRLVFRSTAAQTVRLTGSGLAEDPGLSVSIKGNVDYELDAAFESENAWRVTIPAGIAAGVYDLHVKVGEQTAVLDRELVVAVQGGEKTITFGPYVFTAYNVVQQEDLALLSGYVTMNGWLRFKGDVALRGSLDGSSIRMEETDGAYVQYYEGSSEGLAALFAKNNWKLEIPILGSRTLYNDLTQDPAGDGYRVDVTPIPTLYLTKLLTLNAPGVSLYADRLVLDADAFTTALPFQEKVMEKINGKQVFSFKADLTGLCTATQIGFDAELELKSDNKIYYPVNLGSMPINFNPAEGTIKINTIDNEYSLDFKVRLAFFGDTDDGVGLKLAWKSDILKGELVPDEIGVYISHDVNTNISGVPVTFSDFYFGIKDIDVSRPVMDWTLTGKTTASAVKIDSLLKGLGKWLGDVSVCSFRDATVELSLGQAHLLMKTDFYLLEAIKLSSLEIEAGKFSYSCYLLNMDSEEMAGLRAKLTAGVQWDSSNCDIDIGGSLELVAATKLLGVTGSGNFHVSAQWWVFQKEVRADGSAVLGIYQAHNGDTIFIVKAVSSSDGGNSSVMLSWSKNQGFEHEIKL